MISYKTQFDKLTRAYINDEVNPFDACACFVGNLLDNINGWSYVRGLTYGSLNSCKSEVIYGTKFIKQFSNGTYTALEIVRLEKCFMDIIEEGSRKNKDKEETLFHAFETTLELLKQIHISKGEVIDEGFVFEKRSLVTQ